MLTAKEKDRIRKHNYYLKNVDRIRAHRKSRIDRIKKENPEAWSAKSKEYCKRYRERHPGAAKKYYKVYRQKLVNDPKRFEEKKRKERERTKERMRFLRIECLKIYSKGKMQCECCGESEIRFLTLGHKNNDGNKHRKEIKNRNIYNWCFLNKFPDILSVECFNCNMGKSANGGRCPHKK